MAHNLHHITRTATVPRLSCKLPLASLSKVVIALAVLSSCLRSYETVAQEVTLKAQSQISGADVPYSFPEKLVIAPGGSLYLLDTELSSIFFMDPQTGRVARSCGPELLGSPSDFTIDRRNNLWVLNGLKSKILKLTPDCRVQAEINSRRLPLRIEANALGEILTLTGSGDPLFDVYSASGNLIRSFGKRIDNSNSDLSDGRIVADKSGGCFFSFSYTPLIRHYSQKGELLTEFRPESEFPISPPTAAVRKQGEFVVVSVKYQIPVLDFTVDSRGLLYLLSSGRNKFQALREGTKKLIVVTSKGRVLRKALLEGNFHRIAVRNKTLYLLRNRAPLRIDAYPAF